MRTQAPADARLRMTMCEARDALQAGEVTSETLVELHLERIDAEQPTLKAFTRVFHDRARQEARESDKRRKNNNLKSEFDGVPLTVKECIELAGTEADLGLPSRVGQVSHQDAPVARMLRDAGCVLLGKTNLSQLMIFNESRNPIHGQCVNPYDHGRSPGGSSGGEASAIASFQSMGGIGTDIGGSIRVPAVYCGIYGLLPTLDRIPNRGIVPGIAGQEAIRGQCGPMARSTEDLVALMQLLDPVKAGTYDPKVPPVPAPHPTDVDVKSLKVGVFLDDDVLPASPSVQRAVNEAVDHLKDIGCQVAPFRPPCTREMIFTYLGLLSADGAKSLASQVDFDDLDPALHVLWKMARLPHSVKKVAALGARAVDRDIADLLSGFGEKSVFELWQLVARARTLAKQVFDAWNLHDLDVVIAPPFATPPMPHGMSREFTVGGAFAFHFNFLQWPSGSMPITTVRPGEVRDKAKGKLARVAQECERGGEGLPVGVQIAARPYREDLILAVMQALEERVRETDGYPRLPTP